MDRGAGVYVEDADSVTLTHVTIHKNQGAREGGIYREDGTVRLRNSILSGSTSDGSTVIDDCGGTISETTSTHIQSNDCSASSSGDPRLSTRLYTDTGNNQPHYPLLDTSTLRTSGNDAQCVAGGSSDQVGTTRPATDCSLGAVQYRDLSTDTPTPTDTLTPTDTPTNTATHTHTASPTRHPQNVTLNGTACNIYDAITAANRNTATGSCPAGMADSDGADVIVLQRDVYLTSTLPNIGSKMTIDGTRHQQLQD